MTTERLPLTIPTSRTLKGPIFRKQGDEVIVEYDCEEDDGSLKLSILVFHEPLDFEYRQISACSASDVSSSKEMLCLSQSERLIAIRDRWREFVGSDEWQAKQGGADRFRHFKIFFDDAGCIDVVASGFRILE